MSEHRRPMPNRTRGALGLLTSRGAVAAGAAGAVLAGLATTATVAQTGGPAPASSAVSSAASAPVEAAPVEAAPVEAAPVEAAPVGSGPADVGAERTARGQRADSASRTRPAAPACPTARTMPLRAALAQTLMVGVTSPTRDQLDGVLDGRAPVGGLFLGGDDTAILTDGRMRRVAAARPRPLIAADDEGGRVQRLRALAGDMPSAREQAASMSPAEVRRMAHRRGKALRSYGITMDFGPDVDVSDQPDSAVIGDRSYSEDPEVVTRYARAFAAGLRAAGVLPTIKHFPGHGRAHGDSHEQTATTPGPKALRRVDWVPYRAFAESDTVVMMGHLTVPGLSHRGLPASLDPGMYRLLRREIGFSGLVITDELAGMAAVADRFGLRAAIRRALASGADMTLFNTSPDRVDALLNRLRADVRHGRLSEGRVREAAGRVLAVKGCAPAGQTRSPASPAEPGRVSPG